MCTKPTETCSMPIPLNQKNKYCTEEVPQDALPVANIICNLLLIPSQRNCIHI